jgi:hypothetical protein
MSITDSGCLCMTIGTWLRPQLVRAVTAVQREVVPQKRPLRNVTECRRLCMERILSNAADICSHTLSAKSPVSTVASATGFHIIYPCVYLRCVNEALLAGLRKELSTFLKSSHGCYNQFLSKTDWNPSNQALDCLLTADRVSITDSGRLCMTIGKWL